MQTTKKMKKTSWHDDFYPEVHLVATKLCPRWDKLKIVAGPLASGDPQVTLSHIECLALDLAGPLDALHVLLY